MAKVFTSQRANSFKWEYEKQDQLNASFALG